EADKQADHPEQWRATARLALSALGKAGELLAAGGGTGGLTGQGQQGRPAGDAAVSNSPMLGELAPLRPDRTRTVVKEDHFDVRGTAPLYAKVFGEYGIDPAMPESAAARLRGSRLREMLVAALDDWARVSEDQEERKRLEQLIAAAEGQDAFRARWK